MQGKRRKFELTRFARLTLIIGIAIIGTSLFAPTLVHSSDPAQDQARLVSTAFAATGAKTTGFTVHDWSVIDQHYHTKQELQVLGDQLNQILRIQSPQSYDHTDGAQTVYQLRGNWDPQTSVSMILTSMQFPGKQPQTTLVIRAESKTEQLNPLANQIERIRKAVAFTKAKPQISTCIQGFLGDRMNTVERNQLISNTFHSVNAQEVESVRSDLVTSVSGYSPISQDCITTNGKKMNLQVAIHYDTYRHQTQVLVGSPIVTIEY
jgi:hypothetical protein